MDISPNQVVAFRLRHARELHDWTQDDAAARLEPYLGKRWSQAVFSAAERSFDAKRIKEFNADEIMAFAAAFELPVAFFLIPPPEATMVTARGAGQGLSPSEVLDLALTDRDEIDSRTQAVLRERVEATFGDVFKSKED